MYIAIGAGDDVRRAMAVLTKDEVFRTGFYLIEGITRGYFGGLRVQAVHQSGDFHRLHHR